MSQSLYKMRSVRSTESLWKHHQLHFEHLLCALTVWSMYVKPCERMGFFFFSLPQSNRPGGSYLTGSCERWDLLSLFSKMVTLLSPRSTSKLEAGGVSESLPGLPAYTENGLRVTSIGWALSVRVWSLEALKTPGGSEMRFRRKIHVYTKSLNQR